MSREMTRAERIEALFAIAGTRLKPEELATLLIPDENAKYKQQNLIFKGRSYIGPGGLAFCNQDGSEIFTVTYFEFEGDGATVRILLPEHYTVKFAHPRPEPTAPIHQSPSADMKTGGYGFRVKVK